MVAINAAEIFHRVAFTNSLNWVQELSLVLAMTLYFMVYALIAKDRAYIRIDLAARLLAPKGRRVLALAIRTVILAFHALLAWYAIRAVQFAALFETPILGWGEWVYYLPLAVGCADIVLTELIYLAWQVRGIELPETRAEVLT
jgi:TRAP-type C4-dicarboxylate transport system permease small subunit